MAQALECLTSKHETLTSNPSVTKKELKHFFLSFINIPSFLDRFCFWKFFRNPGLHLQSRHPITWGTPLYIPFLCWVLFFHRIRCWLSIKPKSSLPLLPLNLFLYAGLFWFHLYFVWAFKIIYLFVGLGIEHRAMCLQSHRSTAWVTHTHPVHFVLVTLEMGFLKLFAWTTLKPWSYWYQPPMH
jgi:hypothetical protein